MAIENRTLTPETQLTARYRKEQYTCTVEQGDDGKLVFVLADGRRFKSLSAAASAVMNGIAANGYRFWTPEGDVPAAKAKTGRTAKTGAAPKLIKRIASQKGVEPGLVKYFCASCLDAFTAPAGEEPAACPKGHPVTESAADAPTA